MRNEIDVKLEQCEAKIGDLVKKFNDEAESFKDIEFFFNQLLKDISSPPSPDDLYAANTYIDMLDEQIEKMKSLRGEISSVCDTAHKWGYDAGFDAAKVRSIVNPLIKLESVMSDTLSYHNAEIRAIKREMPLSTIDKDLKEYLTKNGGKAGDNLIGVLTQVLAEKKMTAQEYVNKHPDSFGQIGQFFNVKTPEAPRPVSQYVEMPPLPVSPQHHEVKQVKFSNNTKTEDRGHYKNRERHIPKVNDTNEKIAEKRRGEAKASQQKAIEQKSPGQLLEQEEWARYRALYKAEKNAPEKAREERIYAQMESQLKPWTTKVADYAKDFYVKTREIGLIQTFRQLVIPDIASAYRSIRGKVEPEVTVKPIPREPSLKGILKVIDAPAKPAKASTTISVEEPAKQAAQTQPRPDPSVPSKGP